MNIDTVPSPCINVCKIDQKSSLCVGCLRTLDEIASWGTASNQYKQEVWQNIQLRKLTQADSTPPK